MKKSRKKRKDEAQEQCVFRIEILLCIIEVEVSSGGGDYCCDVLVTVLHDMQLTHTDLKPENILFVSSESELEYDPKVVSDFTALYYHCYVVLRCILQLIFAINVLCMME